MPKLTPPPQECFFAEYLGSKLYILDATLNHRREGWNHNEARYLVIDWDQYDPRDRGMCGDDVDTLVFDIKQTIELRRAVTRHLN